jgi:hypothetical protein
VLHCESSSPRPNAKIPYQDSNLVGLHIVECMVLWSCYDKTSCYALSRGTVYRTQLRSPRVEPERFLYCPCPPSVCKDQEFLENMTKSAPIRCTSRSEIASA